MASKFSAVVYALLKKMIDDTNKWGMENDIAGGRPLLGFGDIVDCIYRGHADMPTELEAVTTEGRRALEKFWNEIGENAEEWNLTDATAAWVLHMLFVNGIRLVFEA